MRVSYHLFPGLFQVGLRVICCVTFVAGTVLVTANEPYS